MLLANTVGLFLGVVAIIGIIWRGGQLLGSITKSMDIMALEVATLRTSRDQHNELLGGMRAELTMIKDLLKEVLSRLLDRSQ